MARTILWFLLTLLTSCVSLRRADNHAGRIPLSDSTLLKLNGRYGHSAAIPGSEQKADLSWNIFDHGYAPTTQHDFIDIQMLTPNSIRVSYVDSVTVLKSKVFKAKVRSDYLVFKRKHLLLPFVFANVYRNRMFRVGLLPNGNIITDYKQLSVGSFYVILPFLDTKKQFGVEFQRISNPLSD